MPRPDAAPDAAGHEDPYEHLEIVLSRSGDEGLSKEPAYQKLKAEGWRLEMAFLVRSEDHAYDQYHLTLRRPLTPPPADEPPASAAPPSDAAPG